MTRGSSKGSKVLVRGHGLVWDEAERGPSIFTTTTRNPLSIILDQNKLTSPNYNDWFQNLEIVLNLENIVHVLDKKPPRETPSDISETELAKLEKWWDHDLQAKSYMLASMSNELQKRFEEAVNAADIHLHLKELYGVQTRSERHDNVKELITTCLRDGDSVHEYSVPIGSLRNKEK
ncbi:uncharacterized protein [Primulina eburnea]|uniref:uncharacterized protein n=1 Tax=Primulina eburnea TaxID=1245227 RepID=UPI003C6CAF44